MSKVVAERVLEGEYIARGDVQVSRSVGQKVALVLALMFGALSVPSFATGLDYSTITGAVDYTTVATAILTVFGLGAVAILAWKGGAMVLSAIRKG